MLSVSNPLAIQSFSHLSRISAFVVYISCTIKQHKQLQTVDSYYGRQFRNKKLLWFSISFAGSSKLSLVCSYCCGVCLHVLRVETINKQTTWDHRETHWELRVRTSRSPRTVPCCSNPGCSTSTPTPAGPPSPCEESRLSMRSIPIPPTLSHTHCLTYGYL